jgi:hypothetical protein
MSSAVVRSIDALRKSLGFGLVVDGNAFGPPQAWAACARLRSVIIVVGTLQLTVEAQIGQASQSAGYATVIGYLPPPPELPM